MDIASFASAAPAWILARLVEILPWLGTLLVGVFAAWLNYYFRAQGRIREAHHAEIKVEVLKPLLQGVESLLALLEQRRPPVGIGVERVEEPESPPRAVETPPVRHRDVLRAAVQQAGPAPWLGSPAEPAAVDRRLYECAKGQHLPDLVRTLEDLAVRVGAYCGRCLRLAEDVQEALTAGAPVRATVFRPPGEPRWLNPLRLARYVLDRRMGYSPSWLDRADSEGTLRMSDGTEVCRAPGRLDACVALVEGLLPDDGRAAALLAETRALASGVPAVRQAVEDALWMGRLEGRCQYLRSRGWRARVRSWWRRVWGRRGGS